MVHTEIDGLTQFLHVHTEKFVALLLVIGIPDPVSVGKAEFGFDTPQGRRGPSRLRKGSNHERKKDERGKGTLKRESHRTSLRVGGRKGLDKFLVRFWKIEFF